MIHINVTVNFTQYFILVTMILALNGILKNMVTFHGKLTPYTQM